MSPDYTIISPRLTLKLISPDEAANFSAIIRHSDTLHQWIDWCSSEFTVKDAERFLLANKLNWVKGQAYGFGLYRRDEDTLVGMVAINELYHTFNMASVGYWIADEYQHNGYAKEGVNALASFCFEQLKLTRVEIVCDPDNLPSHRLALSCGAKQEALAQNRFIYDGKPKAGLVFSILP
ncbi:GNAT family N-acetyltransferase [Vibrio paucivorans]|uniref:GNAT family N-acetyltransferase n=1 Tax=Vibrio paucivorans TaxID=2829489 RepID=A0A9X3CF66_9VIBR|nr:GNAT family protein [Vibrio paucivorans]MCW8334727.1 GNAT family N-acetyltransferase [Vibrio paucivorans]